MWTLSAFCSFLDQIGSEESSCVSPSPPAALEPDSSDADVPAVRHTNITDLINEAYEVRKGEVILNVWSLFFNSRGSFLLLVFVNRSSET